MSTYCTVRGGDGEAHVCLEGEVRDTLHIEHRIISRSLVRHWNPLHIRHDRCLGTEGNVFDHKLSDEFGSRGTVQNSTYSLSKPVKTLVGVNKVAVDASAEGVEPDTGFSITGHIRLEPGLRQRGGKYGY